MKYPFFKPLFWAAAFVLIVGLACGAPASDSEQPPAEPAQPVAPAQPAEPVQPAQPAGATGAVASLQDVQNAVIQIEAVGTFYPLGEGPVTTGWGGSGFIIDPSGLAVTNNHVVTGAGLLKVYIGGDRTKSYNATVVAVSECSDLAVIDIEGDGFSYLDWYAGDIAVGMDVYAAGFPLLEPEYTLTKGIVAKASADGNTSWAAVEAVLMHDATINPGNSGGPLITPDGKVVAVNYRSDSSTASNISNQYFAISREVAKPIIEQLKTGKNVDTIGINGQAWVSSDGSVSGIWVSSVESGSPASKAGIQGGDLLLTIEDLPLGGDGTMSAYCDILRSHNETDTMKVEVYRLATDEFLAGEFNGKALEVVSSGGSGDSSGGSTSGGGAAASGGGGAGEPPTFFTEEFDVEKLENWSWLVTNGDPDQFGLYTQNGRLVFELNGANLYTYLFYDPWLYSVVQLDTVAENRGKNNNNVGLVGQASEDGWYEFSIANNGLWWIWAYDGRANEYNMLANGGSTAVRMGKDSNRYTVICNENKLSLFINGQQTKTLTDTQFAFREGQVGIGVSSFDVLPIILEFDYITIAQP